MSCDRYTCAEILRWLDAYLDLDMDGDAILRFEAHLDACPACRREVAFEQSILRAVRLRFGVEPPADLVTRVRARLRNP